MRRLAMRVLWPSFLAAVLAEGFFFALFDPRDTLHLGEPPMSAMAVYTLFFFFFWSLCALASMLTYYLATVPEDHNPPF